MLVAAIIHHLCMGIKHIANQIARNKSGVTGLKRLNAGSVHGQMFRLGAANRNGSHHRRMVMPIGTGPFKG